MVGWLLTVLVVAVIVGLIARAPSRRGRFVRGRTRSRSYSSPRRGVSHGYTAKPPRQWVTGGEPSTDRQRAVLARRGIDATADHISAHRQGPLRAGECPGGSVVSGSAGLRLRLDPVSCTAHGLCAQLLTERIRLDEWGYRIVDGSTLSADLEEHARLAARECPTRALRLTRSH